MKRFLITAAMAVATSTALVLPAFAADVGVAVSIGQPGFYGRIEIGDFPQPRVIYTQPKVIERVTVERAPVYLRVPPGHAKHWSKHCRKYDACGERVYFVKDTWYQNEYVPQYEKRHGKHKDDDRDDHDKGKGKDKKHGKGHDK